MSARRTGAEPSGATWTRAVARCDVEPGDGGGGSRESGGLDGRLGVEVVQGPRRRELPERLDELALPLGAQIGRHPGMEDDQRPVGADALDDPGQVLDDVAPVHGGRISRGAGGRQCTAQAGEARQVVGPQAGQQPVGAVIGGGIDREGVDPRPARDGRERQWREVAQLSPDHTLEMDRRATPTGLEGGAVRALTVGVGVGVEEQVQTRRCPEVEEPQRLAVGIAGGDGPEGRKEGGAAPDLVGLRAPHGDERQELVPVRHDEVLEVGDHVPARPAPRRRR